MLLSKEVTVEIHLTGCRLRQYIALMLRKEEIPLTPEQFMLIDLLWNLGEMTQQQLADQLQKDKNSVTQLVDALERKGFVERRRNLQDRRSNTLVLTEKAEHLKMEAKRKGILIMDRMLEGITEEEQRTLLTILRKISDNMYLPEL